jgi:hypothetical protein
MEMASSGKKRTTMAKLTRESKLRERRADKQARKSARKLESAERPAHAADATGVATAEDTGSGVGQVVLDPVAPGLVDA